MLFLNNIEHSTKCSGKETGVKSIGNYLYPFTFDEFLRGIGQEMVLPRIEEAFRKDEALSTVIHDQLIERYIQYLYIGGMPAAINEFIRCGFNVVTFDRAVHENIINAYVADMSKYTTKAEVMKVQAIYRSIPDQLAGDQKNSSIPLLKKGLNHLPLEAPSSGYYSVK